MAKRQRLSECKKNIIQYLLQEYDIKPTEDIQDALKDLLGGNIKEMIESEIDEHLGFDTYERSNNPCLFPRILNNICDGYPLSLPCHFVNKWACFNKVYIISNLSLEECYFLTVREHPSIWNAFLLKYNHIFMYKKKHAYTRKSG